MREVNAYFNENNIEVMKRYPDNFFDLAVVDPPYGIGEDGQKNHSRGMVEGSNRQAKAKARLYNPKDWYSAIPDQEYFEQLFRVSKNQIIWGGNYFQDVVMDNKLKYRFDSTGKPIYEKKPMLGATSCWIVWDKQNGTTDFADFEMAWTSLSKAARIFPFRWAGMLQGNMKKKQDRMHPCQKPVELYIWIYKTFAEKGFNILDTHVGSAGSLIACKELKDMNLSYVGCEIDEEYYQKSCERMEYFKYGYSSKLKDGSKELPQASIFG